MIFLRFSFWFLICALIFVAPCSAEDCPLYDAVYKPHFASPSKGKLDFKLTIVKPEEGEGGGSRRRHFFTFTAFDKKTSQKVSMMRLGDASSNGTATVGLSAHMGQFSTLKSPKEFKSTVNFEVVALDKNLYKIYYANKIAPYLYIFPNTGPEIYHDKNNSAEAVSNYIRFYTPEKIYPDFGGADVWIFDSCRK